MQVWNLLQDAKKSRQKSPSGHYRTTLSGYIFANKARLFIIMCYHLWWIKMCNRHSYENTILMNHRCSYLLRPLNLAPYEKGVRFQKCSQHVNDSTSIFDVPATDSFLQETCETPQMFRSCQLVRFILFFAAELLQSDEALGWWRHVCVISASTSMI